MQCYRRSVKIPSTQNTYQTTKPCWVYKGKRSTTCQCPHRTRISEEEALSSVQRKEVYSPVSSHASWNTWLHFAAQLACERYYAGPNARQETTGWAETAVARWPEGMDWPHHSRLGRLVQDMGTYLTFSPVVVHTR